MDNKVNRRTFPAAKHVVEVPPAAEHPLLLVRDGAAAALVEPDGLLVREVLGDGVHDAAHDVLRRHLLQFQLIISKHATLLYYTPSSPPSLQNHWQGSLLQN
jgi:hypothetical protein